MLSDYLEGWKENGMDTENEASLTVDTTEQSALYLTHKRNVIRHPM